MFYLLSLISGLLECGWIAYGVVHSLPMCSILGYVLAYHLGNLFPKPFEIDNKWLMLGTNISLSFSFVMILIKLDKRVAYVMTFISIFFLSACIQTIRSGIKKDVNRLTKRVFRVIGFLISPMAAFYPAGILAIVAIIVIFCLKDKRFNSNICTLSFVNGFPIIMIFHQLHYFFYAHITLTTIGMLFSKRQSFLGIFASAIIFAGTWITYMIVEPIAKKVKVNNLTAFYVGHTIISCILLIMSYIQNTSIFLVLWLLTGLGGGVVFTINSVAKEKGSYKKMSMDIAENIGHALGLFVAVVVSVFAKDNAITIMLRLGSLSAIMTVVTMMWVMRKEKNNETLGNKC